jgi:glycerol-3-phosphate O-acyltransferase
MKSAGYIEIDRQNHEKAMKSMEEAAQKIREGKSVVTFPEGTRSKDGTIKPFKQGLFHLAIQAGVPNCTHLDHRRRQNHAEADPEGEAGTNHDDHRPAGGCVRIHD